MKKTIYLLPLLLLGLFLSSCEKFQEDVLPVVGVYDANIVGVGGPYSISVSVDFGNNIMIDAPWDGEIWEVVDAEVRDQEFYEKSIKIFDQNLSDDSRIWGDGVFFDYTIQLDYTIRKNGIREHYTMVATKL